MQKSQEFWVSNKNIEKDIDILLKNLKSYDQGLEKFNNDIYEICRTLDYIEENIKNLLNNKTEDHIRQAEPLFEQKKR